MADASKRQLTNRRGRQEANKKKSGIADQSMICYAAYFFCPNLHENITIDRCTLVRIWNRAVANCCSCETVVTQRVWLIMPAILLPAQNKKTRKPLIQRPSSPRADSQIRTGDLILTKGLITSSPLQCQICHFGTLHTVSLLSLSLSDRGFVRSHRAACHSRAIL